MRYVTSVQELHHPDMIFLPGSKNTMGDLKWMRQNGLEAAVKKLSEEIPVFGICGGYQMLGRRILDTDSVEEGGSMRGMELLPIITSLEKEKKRGQVTGIINQLQGIFSELSGESYTGYELHMGRTQYNREESEEQCANPVITGERENVYGSYKIGRAHV